MMKKISVFLIPILCLLLGIGIYLNLRDPRELSFIDDYFDTSFRNESYTVTNKKHFPGRDFGYIYTVKITEYTPDGVFDLENYEEGCSGEVLDLIRLMGGELPSEEVKSLFFHDTHLGHRMALVYDTLTGEYTIYFQTF